jgi:hypothetical protein
VARKASKRSLRRKVCISALLLAPDDVLAPVRFAAETADNLDFQDQFEDLNFSEEDDDEGVKDTDGDTGMGGPEDGARLNRSSVSFTVCYCRTW